MKNSPMISTLYLTDGELNIFHSLSDERREGWKVEEADISFVDNDQLRKIRQSLVSVSSPAVKAILHDAASFKNDEEVVKRILALDVNDIPESDLTELFFVIGPSELSKIIMVLLQGADQDERSLVLAAAASGARRILDTSLLSS